MSRVPGPLAAALMTGRPELARFVGPADEQAISDFAESVVRSVTEERRAYELIERALEMAIANTNGNLAALERLHAAVQCMRRGDAPEQVTQALANPKRKEES